METGPSGYYRFLIEIAIRGFTNYANIDNRVADR